MGNVRIEPRSAALEMYTLPLGQRGCVTNMHGEWTILFTGCLTSQQHASVPQGRICSDNFTCCHTEIEVADQTFHLIQSQYTDTTPTSPSTDPITPGAWQGSHWSANFEVTGMTRPRRNPGASEIRTRESSALEADALTTRPTRRCEWTRQRSIHAIQLGKE